MTEKIPHLVKKDICFNEKEFVMLDRLKKNHCREIKQFLSRKGTMRNGLQVGLCIGKTDDNFSEKGIDFCPATLVTVRKGPHIVKTDSLI